MPQNLDPNRINPDTPNYVPFDPVRRHEFIPVDTMVNAKQAPSTNTALQLGQALSGVQPKIQQLLDGMQQRQQTADGQQAQIDHDQLVAQGITTAEAVKRNIIPASASNFYMQTMYHLDGQNAGDQAASSILAAYQNDPIRDSKDPAAIQQWFAQKAQPFIQSAQQQEGQGSTGFFGQNVSKGYLAGFLTNFNPVQGKIMAAQQQQVDANVKQGMVDAYGTQANNVVSSYLGEIGQNGQPFNAQDLQSRLAALSVMPQFAGVSRKQSDEILTDAVIAAAKTAGNKDVLQVLSTPRPDKDPNAAPGSMIPGIGSNALNMGKVFNAGKEIDDMNQRKQDHQFIVEEHNRTMAIQNSAPQVTAAIMAGKDPDPEALAQWLKNDQHAASEIISLKTGMIKLAQDTNPGGYSLLENDLIAGDPTKSRVAVLADMIKNRDPRVQNIAGPQLAELTNKLQDMDQSGVSQLKPVAMLLHGMEPDAAGKSIFSDASVQKQAQAVFLEKARAIQQSKPGQDADSLMPDFTKAYDDTLNFINLAHPNLVGVKSDEKSHVSGTPDEPIAQPPTTRADDEPAPRADGTMGNPSFGGPSPAEVKAIQARITDPVAVAAFRQKYGDRAYLNAKNGIR